MQSILVVDDDRATREVMQETLECLGFRVCLAATTRGIVQTVRACSPDLIILDIMMPDLDGIAAAALIRNANFDMPIVFSTAYVPRGMDALAGWPLLRKPFAIDELTDTITRLLELPCPSSPAPP